MIEFIPKVNDFCINRRSVDYLFPDLKKMRFIWVSMYLARKLLIGDTIFTSPTGDGSAILLGHPASHAKV